MKLDSRDIAILQVLIDEGRIAKTALAEKVNLSPTPCWNRLRKMEEAGVISGYRAQVDLRRIAPHTSVFVAAELRDHTAPSFARFESAVQGIEEITGCWAVGGGYDYLMQVIAPDIDAFQRFMDGLLERDIGLARYFSYIVTKPVKGPASPPLAALVAAKD
ncbi:transcriptional regulator, AsnC family [Salinihabitans flavidus]|uniref:Transcriptional regulator, AsnC family n=1 Tax=Salinihabitans flavidus TaxID=569882 RepID=A0A1H8NVW9_9RHOB|nr:Lrp/AsnC family transcriptional regulator [Salinihabitans flavidus]SEO33796.1 transcriptional regulator, AsnC family [Salinihabitans flavidus]